MNRIEDPLSGIYSSTIAEVSVLVREVRVRVGVLSKSVTIRIYYDAKSSQPYRYELSARMKTSRAFGSRDSQGTAASEGDALRHAVRMLTQDYEDAVRQGVLPDDSWLIDVGER